jgi:hypothetical protein
MSSSVADMCMDLLLLGVSGRPARSAVRAHAAGQPKKPAKQPELSARNAQLYELSGDDGWEVEVTPSSSSSSAAVASQAKSAAKQKADVQQPAKPGRAWRSFADCVDSVDELGVAFDHVRNRHCQHGLPLPYAEPQHSGCVCAS